MLPGWLLFKLHELDKNSFFVILPHFTADLGSVPSLPLAGFLAPVSSLKTSSSEPDRVVSELWSSQDSGDAGF